MKPVVLVVMDGWGINPKSNPGVDVNAVAVADTPNIDALTKEYPYVPVNTSGAAVGLPEGQMGNSEVGHLTLGSGRVILQELTRINRAVSNGELHNNATLTDCLVKVKGSGKALHLMGLLSDGGVHSHMEHLYGLLEAAKGAGIEEVFIHAFLDGRDTAPKSAKGFMEVLLRKTAEIGGCVASVSGRYYAMDRDSRWERVSKAYNAIVEGRGRSSSNPLAAIEAAYERGESDEFVEPTVMVGSDGSPVGTINDGDGVIFFNFRSDRARELTSAIVEEDFTGFERESGRRELATFLTMTDYGLDLSLPVIFKPKALTDILGTVLSQAGINQFRVSETEKYAHVTFFFNGGVEEASKGEDRFLIPSQKDVATYDEAPLMRCAEIADSAISAIESEKYGFILMNFANGDMVGHTGVFNAAVRACEAVDRAVGRVVNAAKARGAVVIITADHGNVEEMKDAAGELLTAHTTNPVPLILVDDDRVGAELKTGLGLSSIAPTILKIMEIDIPKAMDGEPLI